MTENKTPTDVAADAVPSPVEAPTQQTPVVTMPDLKEGTLRASVVIGTQSSVAKELSRLYPLGETDETKRHFYSPIPYADQIKRIVDGSKYKNSHYVYGMVVFGENMPDADLSPEMKSFPKNVREFRVQRVEIHR